jgi:hypothetical protein
LVNFVLNRDSTEWPGHVILQRQAQETQNMQVDIGHVFNRLVAQAPVPKPDQQHLKQQQAGIGGRPTTSETGA